jgi:hypothetical protein
MKTDRDELKRRLAERERAWRTGESWEHPEFREGHAEHSPAPALQPRRRRPSIGSADRAEARKILNSGLVSLTGKALDAWLRREWPDLKSIDRPRARSERRESMTFLDRAKERRRESDFAREFVARAAARKDPPAMPRRPRLGEPYRWDSALDAATNAFEQKKHIAQGGARC